MALTQVTSAGLKDGEIVNADLNSSAAIALSKLASTPAVLTGSTNNTLTTVTAANAITGEANLTFDGSALNATAGAASLTIKSTNAQTAGQLHFDGDAVTTADYWLGNINGRWNGNDVAAIRFEAGDDTTNKDDGRITFHTSDASSTPDERMRIKPTGEVAIGGTGYAGQPFSVQTSGVNLGWMESTGTTRAVMNFSDANSTVGVGIGCIGNNHVFLKDSTEKVRIQGSGGISFNGDTAAANALNDYEEGTHVTALVGSGSVYSDANGLSYVKVGNVVTVSGQIRIQTGDAGDIQLTLPFSAGSNANDASHNFVGSLNTYNSTIHASSTAQGICTQIGAGTNHVSFMATWNDSPWTALPTTANGYYRFTITYFTA